LSGKDVGVFWATSHGKSIVYQFPPFYLSKTAVVVSPLVSLMQDQVRNLNMTIGGQFLGGDCAGAAVLLGSAATNPNDENLALQGKFRIIYVTPEKLMTSNFLQRLSCIPGGLSLIAVDEAHVVSEWGNDFRPEYSQLSRIREFGPLASVPLVCLTATAVPRVRDNIIQNLKMRSPVLSIKSFDRPNLAISVMRRPDKTPKMLELIVKTVRPKSVLDQIPSTIVYCSTVRDAEKLGEQLQASFGPGVVVRAYTGSMGMGARTEVHMGFLTGSIHVVCATIAFGMGIDKPDIRHIIHFDAPRNIESYYQHVGRAGRDGQPASALMLYSEGDFTQYCSDFYLREFSKEARQVAIEATNSLMRFATDNSTCRRRALLLYFEETPTFERCGACDCCLARLAASSPSGGGSAQVFDLAREAEAVLRILSPGPVLRGQLSNIILNKVPKDKLASLKPGVPLGIGAIALNSRTAHTIDFPLGPHAEVVWKDLLVHLRQVGFVGIETRVGTRAYELVSITPQGSNWLRESQKSLVMNPPPEGILAKIREKEANAAAAKAKVESELKAAGIAASEIGEEDLDDNPSNPSLSYARMVRGLHSGKRPVAAAMARELKDKLLAWRAATAVTLGIAPASALPHAILFGLPAVALERKVDAPSLVELGLRLPASQLSELAEHVDALVSSYRAALDAEQVQAAAMLEADAANRVKIVAGGPTFSRPGGAWPHTPDPPVPIVKGVPKPLSWAISYDLFMSGKGVTAIAAERGFQPGTIVGHLLQALTAGRMFVVSNLEQELAAQHYIPTTKEWSEYEAHLLTAKFDPTLSTDSSSFMGLVRPAVESGNWYNKANFFLAAKRALLPIESGKSWHSSSNPEATAAATASASASPVKPKPKLFVLGGDDNEWFPRPAEKRPRELDQEEADDSAKKVRTEEVGGAPKAGEQSPAVDKQAIAAALLDEIDFSDW
jgi:RecQ family ATP-dependent DNA helicase